MICYIRYPHQFKAKIFFRFERLLMNKASTTLLVFGIYAVAVGLSLLLIPNIITGLFTLPVADEVWIRVVGILAICVGFYHIQASRDNNQDYFAMTVWGRVLFAIGMTGLALLTPNHLPLILFGLVDLLGAIWTWYAQRQEGKIGVAVPA